MKCVDIITFHCYRVLRFSDSTSIHKLNDCKNCTHIHSQRKKHIAKIELVDAVMIMMLKIMKIKTFFQVNGHREYESCICISKSGEANTEWWTVHSTTSEATVTGNSNKTHEMNEISRDADTIMKKKWKGKNEEKFNWVSMARATTNWN